jgi:hypothetical protein
VGPAPMSLLIVAEHLRQVVWVSYLYDEVHAHPCPGEEVPLLAGLLHRSFTDST